MNSQWKKVWIATLLAGVAGLVLTASASARSRARPRLGPAHGCVKRLTKAMLRIQSSAQAKNIKAYRKALKRARLVRLRGRPRLGRRLSPKRARLLVRQRRRLVSPRPWPGRALGEGQVVNRGGNRHLVVFVKVDGRLSSKGLRVAKDRKGALWAVRRQEVRRKSVVFNLCRCRPSRPGRGVRHVSVSVPWTVVLPKGKTYKGIKIIRYPVDRVYIKYRQHGCRVYLIP